jgi:CarD family transcriptional regulator
MVPTKSSERAGLRGIVSTDGISNIYSILSTPHKVAQRAWNRRFREFNEKLKASMIEDVAEVLRDLWTLQSTKELSFGEKQMLEKAMELIVSEISASRGMSLADAQVEIRNKLVSLH